VFLGFLGRNPHAHNLACTRRLDYVHARLFMHAHEPDHKILILFCLFLLILSHVYLIFRSFFLYLWF